MTNNNDIFRFVRLVFTELSRKVTRRNRDHEIKLKLKVLPPPVCLITELYTMQILKRMMQFIEGAGGLENR